MSLLHWTALVVGLLLVFTGLFGGGWGVYAAEKSCKSGTAILIYQETTDETPDGSPEEVAFQNLSAEQQRVFRETLNSEHNVTYENSRTLRDLTDKHVAYRGKLYSLQRSHSDCPMSAAYAPFLLGTFVFLLGVGLANFGWEHVQRP